MSARAWASQRCASPTFFAIKLVARSLTLHCVRVMIALSCVGKADAGHYHLPFSIVTDSHTQQNHAVRAVWGLFCDHLPELHCILKMKDGTHGLY
jgi:hypothetical protein